jgi:hypothetical protein
METSTSSATNAILGGSSLQGSENQKSPLGKTGDGIVQPNLEKTSSSSDPSKLVSV